jgi:CBS domain-containing protein
VALETCLACAQSGGIVRDPVDRLEYASCRHASARAEVHREEGGPAVDHTPVSAVMTTDLFAVRPEVAVEAVAELLLERGIGGAPVVDEAGHLVGVVSKTDLIEGAQVRPAPHHHAVAEAMTRGALTVPESAPVVEAAALMSGQGIHRVLVVTDEGELAGIVTSEDIVRWVARGAARGAPAS